jgi:hypothetical protein
MKYDDATWHSGGDFPEDLPPEAGATHTGMYLAWALLSGLGGRIHTEECPEDLECIRNRELTPGAFFLKVCDGKFTDEDLNDEGNAFTSKYFDLETGSYVEDYTSILDDDLESIYHVADSWETFELIRPLLDRKLAAWRRDA